MLLTLTSVIDAKFIFQNIKTSFSTDIRLTPKPIIFVKIIPL